MKQSYLHDGLLQAGKYSKRQAFVLPGDINKLLRIRACSVSVYLTQKLPSMVECMCSEWSSSCLPSCLWQVADDVVREICALLALEAEADVQEYGLYVDMGSRECTTGLGPLVDQQGQSLSHRNINVHRTGQVN